MKYALLADTYEAVERTTKRLEMRDLLVDLFKKTPPEIIDKVVYLTLGELYPPFVGIEVGIAEKMALKSIAIASGASDEQVVKAFKEKGDIGLVAEELLQSRAQAALFREPLTVEQVYEILDRIARASGPGSYEEKIKSFASLLADATPKEARYLGRTVTKRLRLGIADMTVLDALAIAFAGGVEYRVEIERAYNLSSDLGHVARTLAEGGMEAIHEFKITIGKPIRPQLAERLASLEEILDKLGGIGSAEYKYDGLRLQGHIREGSVMLFSRRLENLTNQFPDVCKALVEGVKAREAVVDGECVPVDPDTGELLPFQVVARRRGRKYGIEEAMREVPVVLFLFDLLYLDGNDLTAAPYIERRKMLEQIIEESDKLRLAKYIVSSDKREIERYFEKAVAEGTEGLILKSPSSVYEAGKRGFAWIKWKRSYRSEMADTVDLVAVGAFAGRGKRAGTYGALLMAAYDPETDSFKTVCKLGSGFTDEDLAKLPEILKPYMLDHKHPRVDSIMEADFWFVPTKVLEVIGDEITLSPLHTCGLDVIKEGSGLAIRFPRLIRFREDRAPEDATTVGEIIEMYERQLKHIR